MFDIGWTELAVIAGVAVIVVGPKDLPGMLRTVGRTMGQVRRTANDFRRQFDDALREAERQADLGDTKKTLQSISKMDPLADLKKDVETAVNKPAGKPAKTAEPPMPSAFTEAPKEAGAAAEPETKSAVPEPAPATGTTSAEPGGANDGQKSDAA